MNDLIKWTIKHTIVAIFWVFILSINYQGKTIFSYANNTLVQNSFVSMLDEELGNLWVKANKTARITFKELSNSGEILQ